MKLGTPLVLSLVVTATAGCSGPVDGDDAFAETTSGSPTSGDGPGSTTSGEGGSPAGTTTGSGSPSSQDASSSTSGGDGGNGGNGSGGEAASTGGGAGEGGAGAGGSGGGAGGPCGGADLAGDPDNCGSCGHDCLGGDCLDGACQPVLIAPIESAIAVDATSIYAYSSGAILKLDKAANAEPDALASVAPYLWDIAVDFVNVFGAPVSSPAQIFRVSKSGGNAVNILQSAPEQGQDVAVDDFAAYYLHFDGDVMAASKTGSAPYVVQPALPNDRAGLLAVDESFVYWAVTDTTVSFWYSSIVKASKLTWEDRTPIATGARITSYAIDASDVFWVDWEQGVYGAPLDGGPALELVSAAVAGATALRSNALIVDGAYVYWASSMGLHRVPKDGGSFETIATGMDLSELYQSRMAGDGAALYFSANGGIHKLAH